MDAAPNGQSQNQSICSNRAAFERQYLDLRPGHGALESRPLFCNPLLMILARASTDGAFQGVQHCGRATPRD